MKGKKSVAHKSGRQFFEMDVRGFRTSLQDDAMEGDNLDGREIPNFGQKFYEFSFQTIEGAVVRLLVVFSGMV